MALQLNASNEIHELIARKASDSSNALGEVLGLIEEVPRESISVTQHLLNILLNFVLDVRVQTKLIAHEAE